MRRAFALAAWMCASLAVPGVAAPTYVDRDGGIDADAASPRSAWAQPGFSLGLTFGWVTPLSHPALPAADGFAFALQPAVRLSPHTGLMALFAYGVPRGGTRGVRLLAMPLFVWNIWDGLAASAGVGYAGAWLSSNTYSCQAIGGAVLARLHYTFALSDAFATGPLVQVHGALSRCAGTHLLQPQNRYWQPSLSAAWLLAWR